MSARLLAALLLIACGSICALGATGCSAQAAPSAAPPAPTSVTPPPAASPAPSDTHEAEGDEPVLVGPVTREQVEEAVPDWVQAEVEAAPDPAAVRALTALAAAKPGAEVTVYLGTWCGDSRRELARFWRALDDSGGVAPFAVKYIGVDRDKKEPAALVADSGLLYVPTFVVRRDGREVGRIVEQSPNGVERDLLSLVDGSAQGLLTAKPELLPEKQP